MALRLRAGLLGCAWARLILENAPETWKDLGDFLPRSIKRVAQLYVLLEFNVALGRLVRNLPAELPNLRSIHLRHLPPQRGDDEGDDSDDWFLDKAGEQERL